VGTVFIGYQDAAHSDAREYHFTGDREAVRNQTIDAALKLVLEYQKE
jgi:nicotinamide mononucleotide (NMN) deamidase PncC